MAPEGAGFSLQSASPWIAGQLAAGLLDLPEGSRLADDDLLGFAHLLDQCEKLAKKAPVIILDQFEDAFRRDESGEALARLGPLLAASTRLAAPGGAGFRCRWVLSYRGEYHGPVVTWLRDVLSDARTRGRAGLEQLPWDLSREAYFREMPIGPLAAAVSHDEATAVFLKAITTPLELKDADGARRYPYRFEDGGAERLAGALAAARMERPRAPLLPELQVVLDQLLRGAKAGADGVAIVVVPEDVHNLVENALGKHLEETLRKKFLGNDAKRLRALALLTLRDLADAEGKRGEGIAPVQIEQRLGVKYREVVPVLQDARLMVRDGSDEEADGGDWVLPHDQMAGAIVKLWGNAEMRRRYEIDDEVIELQEKVRRRMEMHRHGEVEGTALSEDLFKRVEALRVSLLWDEECEAWWVACVDRRRLRREARRMRDLRVAMVSAGGVLTGAALLLWLLILPNRAMNHLREVTTPKDAEAALHDFWRYPTHAGEAKRLFDARVATWANVHLDRLRIVRDVRNAWTEYQELLELPGYEAKANNAYAEFLIHQSRETALRHEFELALLQRLRAAATYDGHVDGNMEEVAYLESLFPTPQQEAQIPIPADVKWVPHGRLPVASLTRFVGDYVLLPPMSDSPESAQLWSTRNQSSEPIASDPEEIKTWGLFHGRGAFTTAERRQLRKALSGLPGDAAECARNQLDTDLSSLYPDAYLLARGCFSWEYEYAVIDDGSIMTTTPHGRSVHPVGIQGGQPRSFPQAGEWLDVSKDAKAALYYSGWKLQIMSLPNGKVTDLAALPEYTEIPEAHFSTNGDRVAVISSLGYHSRLVIYTTAGGENILDTDNGYPAQFVARDHYTPGRARDQVRLSYSGKIAWLHGHGVIDVDHKRHVCTGAQLPTLSGAFYDDGVAPVFDEASWRALFMLQDRIDLWELTGGCTAKTQKPLKSPPMWATFDQRGEHVVMMAQGFAVHFFDLTATGLEPHGTRLVRGVQTQNTSEKVARVIEDGSALEVVVQRSDSTSSVGLQRVVRDLPSDAAKQWDPKKQLNDWQRWRQLVISEKGEITQAPPAP